MASSSSSFPPYDPSSSVSCAYDVFLSFRGEDTRNSFVDHLYAALDQRGFYTFKDDERLRGGDVIPHELLKAIEQSRSAIVVFSKNYASSSWCLDELVKIMDCKEKLGLIVYPVFYDVDPSEVRWQTGTFGKGFARAAERPADKAPLWRKALQNAANLSGYNVRETADGREAQCIKKVVEWCFIHSCNISAIDENLIGITPRVRHLMSLLGNDIDDVRMIGIWGMGGSGKTTLARVTFNGVLKHFDGASFIPDVREKSKTVDGLQLLQKKILSNILMEKFLEVDSVSEGKEMIKRRLGHKKVLIILDDVDDVEQLRALAGELSWFGNGSRVLITTRDQHSLVAHGVDKIDIHCVNLLTEDEAILLFNRHAFKKCSPTKEYNELSLCVVRYAAGLPLALTVLGSFLCGRGMTEWISALKRLEKIPEGKILEKLQISYDGLKQVEKEIFLDIACFFIGWPKYRVVRILDCCEFDPVIGIDVLVQKSFISLSNENYFQMHDLLQEMGRSIGRQNRLWRSEDVHDVLQNNTGTEAIEAIVSEHPKKHTCDSKAFTSMKKLRLLILRNYRCTSFAGPEYLPDELQSLHWLGYPHESLPESFQGRKLVGLEMHHSSIVQLWEGKKLLDKLKFLNLSYSEKLIRTPDFSSIPNLQELGLRSCSSLIEVHRSIGDLQRLVLLDLSLCGNLENFPSIIQMKSLEILNFYGCWKFKRFPELGRNMDRLSNLHLDHTGIEDLPSSIANLTKLVSMNLSGCKNLLDLPDTICVLKYLKRMNLSNCRKLRKLPENLGHIESLEELQVGGSGVKVLPSSIGHLKNLRHVSFKGSCELILEDSMAHMTHIGSCLKVLELSRCELSDHQAIHIDIGHLSFLEELYLTSNPFAFLPFIISQLSRLKFLKLSWCKNLKALPELPSSIAILWAYGCTSLESIESLSAGKHEWLWYISLGGCKSLTMDEICDQYYCHEQEYSITKQQPKRYKLDLCGKQGKMLTLLQSMLQGHAAVNHQLHIYYTVGVERAIPKWFGQEVMKGNRFILKLPPNWQNKITGFAMRVVMFEYVDLKINLSVCLSEVGRQVPASRVGKCSLAHGEVWIGYISLKMLQRSTQSIMPAGWMDAVTQLLLTFSAPSKLKDDDGSAIESCAARVVSMDENRVVCMDEVENSEASTTCSSSGSLQQLYDPYFAPNTTLRCYKVPGSANRITFSFIPQFE